MACPYISEKDDKLLCKRNGQECGVINFSGCPAFKQGFFGNPDRPIRVFQRP